MTKQLNLDFERAVRLLAQYFPISKEDSRKPVLFHDIRVGVYLYEHEYSPTVVLAGLLHDAIEWSDMTEDMLRREFGDAVTAIVLANTKNREITNPNERIDDLVRRCVATGKNALIVKAADTLDSFRHYTKTENENEIDYCVRNARAILRFKPDDWHDEILEELQQWLVRNGK